MDTFTIYHVERWPGIGMPLLITTIRNDVRGQWAGEIYLLLEDVACTLLQDGICHDGTTWPEVGPQLDEVYMEGELLARARTRMGLHRENSGIDAKHGLLTHELRLDKTSATALSQFWMQSKCSNRLTEIRDHTKSDSLRAQLARVTSRPRFNEPRIEYESPFSGVDLPPDYIGKRRK